MTPQPRLLEPRSETELRERQRRGELRVCSGAAFRERVAAQHWPMVVAEAARVVKSRG